MFTGKKSSSSLLLLLLLTLILAAPHPVYAAWSAETRLTSVSGSDGWPSIAQMKNNDVWIVWTARRGSMSSDIYYRVHYSVNDSWSSPPKRLFVSSKEDNAPFILQTRNGTLWVFWSMNYNSDFDIVYRQSNDYANWTYTYTVTNSTSDPSDVPDDEAPSALEALNGDLWVVWQREVSPGNEQIFYKVLHENTWSATKNLTSSPVFHRNPTIVQANNGSIIVFWTEYVDATNFDIAYRSYNGTSWGLPQMLTATPGAFSSDPYALLTRTGAIWVAYVAQDLEHIEVPDNIFCKTSEDNGETWSAASLIMENASQYNSQPAMTQGVDKRVWLSWQSDRDGDFEIYYKTSDTLLYHDVAVTDIRPSKTSAYQGSSVQVTVDAENQGDYSQTLVVKLYANNSLIGTNITWLPGGSMTSIVYTWNTISFVPGNYAMKAAVDAVPDESTINLGDNTLTRGSIFLRIPGDVNADGKVNIDDLIQLSNSMGSVLGQPRWNPECDINGDGMVDTIDLHILGRNYGP